MRSPSLGFPSRGPQYRCGKFLATSLEFDTAKLFAKFVASTDAIPGVCGERKRVIFEIQFNDQRCMHANYIGPNETEVKGEAELLLPPYSGFEVVSVPDFSDPVPVEGYYQIVLRAFNNNVGTDSVSEAAPVAIWH